MHDCRVPSGGRHRHGYRLLAPVRAVASALVGVELHEDVDPGGAERALTALEQHEAARGRLGID
ncbi:hypothetical protein [Streptomyces sp. NPDC002537]